MPNVDTEPQGPSPKGNFRLSTPEQREAWETCAKKARRLSDARPAGPVISVSTMLQRALVEFAAESDEATLTRLGLS